MILLLIPIILLITMNTVENIQENYYYVDYANLKGYQQTYCGSSILPDKLSTTVQQQQTIQIQQIIKQYFYNKSLKWFMDNKMGLTEYMKYNSFYYLAGIVIFIITIFMGLFQLMVMFKGNNCYVRNLQTNKIENWEVKVNLWWVIMGTIMIIIVNIMLMMNQANFKSSIQASQCAFSAFYNHALQGDNSQQQQKFNTSWQGLESLLNNHQTMQSYIYNEVTRLSLLTADYTSFFSQYYTLTAFVSNLYTQFYGQQMVSPARTDFATINTVYSLYLQTAFGPPSLNNTALNNIQNNINLYYQSINNRQFIQNNALNMLNDNFYSANLYQSIINSTYSQINTMTYNFISLSQTADILIVILNAITYITLIFLIILSLTASQVARSLYEQFRIKFRKRLNLLWIILMVFSLLFALMLTVLLPYLVQLNDYCELLNVMNLNSTNLINYSTVMQMSQASAVIMSQCLFNNNGTIYNMIPGYGQLQQVTQLMTKQWQQFNMSNMSDPMFLNVLNVRIQLANQVTLVTNIQNQYVIDSDLTTEQNHFNSLAQFNKWTDFNTNLYIICKISGDQFIFSPNSCPAGYQFYQATNPNIAAVMNKTCLFLKNMNLNTVALRYSYSLNNAQCLYQLGAINNSFIQLQLHYNSRFALFANLISQLNIIQSSSVNMENMMFIEQSQALSSFNPNQLYILNQLTSEQTNFNCKFAQKHLTRSIDAVCNIFLPTFYFFVFYLFILNFIVLYLSNRIFAFVQFQLELQKQIKLYKKIAELDDGKPGVKNDKVQEIKQEENEEDNVLNLFIEDEEQVQQPKNNFSQYLLNLALEDEKDDDEK